ncbi:MAG: IS1 family transposase [Candidatus Korobacteraceae bacterium]|jgi:transposase-like protein/IS1 family transposase
MTCKRCQHTAKKFGRYGKRHTQRYKCTTCQITFSDYEPKLGTHYTDPETAAKALAMMMEGMSVRAISRLTGLHVGTILGLMVTAGEKCQRVLNATIRGIRPNLVQADELHSFVGCHENRLRSDAPKEWGSSWTWLALDSESKLIISYHVGNRDAESAWEFIRDLRERTDGIFQLTTDGLRAYVDAVDAHFDVRVHFAQLIKLYSSSDFVGPDWFGATSRVTGTIPSVRSGQPEPRFISTSHVERLNLSVRTHLRRFVRRTNAHSRKLANHRACISLWVAWYNLCRLNTAIRMTPAMAAGVTDHIWSLTELFS